MEWDKWDKSKSISAISSFLDFHYTIGSRGQFTILSGRCGKGLLELVLDTKRDHYFSARLFGRNGNAMFANGALNHCMTFELVPEDLIPGQTYRSVVIHARHGVMTLTQESIAISAHR